MDSLGGLQQHPCSSRKLTICGKRISVPLRHCFVCSAGKKGDCCRFQGVRTLWLENGFIRDELCSVSSEKSSAGPFEYPSVFHTAPDLVSVQELQVKLAYAFYPTLVDMHKHATRTGARYRPFETTHRVTCGGFIPFRDARDYLSACHLCRW
ncbi:hypothetical protein BV20DRAFT_297902 [Pilatotrama ljubarskyi]|nr:hypothetical protein BV20DRAFT_297902 [Pilatotrama ljubarskyi]